MYSGSCKCFFRTAYSIVWRPNWLIAALIFVNVCCWCLITTDKHFLFYCFSLLAVAKQSINGISHNWIKTKRIIFAEWKKKTYREKSPVSSDRNLQGEMWFLYRSQQFHADSRMFSFTCVLLADADVGKNEIMKKTCYSKDGAVDFSCSFFFFFFLSKLRRRKKIIRKTMQASCLLPCSWQISWVCLFRQNNHTHMLSVWLNQTEFTMLRVGCPSLSNDEGMLSEDFLFLEDSTCLSIDVDGLSMSTFGTTSQFHCLSID